MCKRPTMKRPRLHILCPAHTMPTDDFSCCAFTGKAVRIAEMMTGEGWECTVYHNGACSTNLPCESVVMLTQEEMGRAKIDTGVDMYDYLTAEAYRSNLFDFLSGRADTPTVTTLTILSLASELKKRMGRGDIVCHTFGYQMGDIHRMIEHSGGVNVEVAIGYGNTWAEYKIYESYAWAHHNFGAKSIQEFEKCFVIPTAYRESDWPQGENRGYVLWGSRFAQNKGSGMLVECARARPSTRFVVAFGHEFDIGANMPGNIEFVGRMSGRERMDMWSNAGCALMPTKVIEPFGGFHIECQMCGVPSVTSEFGVFSETVQSGVNGFRCRGLDDFVRGIDRAVAFSDADRSRIRDSAVSKYSCKVVAPMYTRVFEHISRPSGNNWANSTII